MKQAKSLNTKQTDTKTKKLLCSYVLMSFFPKKSFVFYRNNNKCKMTWRVDYGG